MAPPPIKNILGILQVIVHSLLGITKRDINEKFNGKIKVLLIKVSLPSL